MQYTQIMLYNHQQSKTFHVGVQSLQFCVWAEFPFSNSCEWIFMKFRKCCFLCHVWRAQRVGAELLGAMGAAVTGTRHCRQQTSPQRRNNAARRAIQSNRLLTATVRACRYRSGKGVTGCSSATTATGPLYMHHYEETWRYLQNRKYVTYRTVVRGQPIRGRM